MIEEGGYAVQKMFCNHLSKGVNAMGPQREIPPREPNEIPNPAPDTLPPPLPAEVPPLTDPRPPAPISPVEPIPQEHPPEEPLVTN